MDPIHFQQSNTIHGALNLIPEETRRISSIGKDRSNREEKQSHQQWDLRH